MSEAGQNFKNHARFHPPFHYVVAPIFVFHFVWTARGMWRQPSWNSAEALLVAIGLLALAVVSRTSALKAQDRTIRLEERLRYAAVLPPDLAARASELPVGKIVALRFASDGELAGLVGQVLSGQLKSGKEIKKSIKNWRADTCRV
ncbi:DUF6526 family protein [Bryobacter aggregatus]|uniref:DUF6526 family protein n=1 Tax=Bryobacter aggregatus TaxID=360054 RepID=UPI0004E15356|nr:DUF6526 family protein [Bryobacter aggregatus]